VEGYFGYEDVNIGGLVAPHQQLAMVNYSYWFGDGLTSGLLGLAYPMMTGLGGFGTPAYDPVFTTMYKHNAIPPLFSLALARDDDIRVDASGGVVAATPLPAHDGEAKVTPKPTESYLAFGGVPPVAYDRSAWARTPILSMSALPAWGMPTTTERGLYIIQADSYVYGTRNGSAEGMAPATQWTRNTTQFPVLVDSGTTLSVLPTGTAAFRLFWHIDPYSRWSGLFGVALTRT
jgi:hypothetical protein